MVMQGRNAKFCVLVIYCKGWLCYNLFNAKTPGDNFFMPEDHQDPQPKVDMIRYMGMGLGLGLIFGAALGILVQNMLIGVPVGAVLGLVIGWLLGERAKQNQ
jgi:hypothetical protein